MNPTKPRHTPLFAAMEILIYGLLWLLSRRDRGALGYGERPMLDASVLQLTVLAPRPFDRGFHLSAFMASLDTEIVKLGRLFGVEMGLRPVAFPEALAGRRPTQMPSYLRCSTDENLSSNAAQPSTCPGDAAPRLANPPREGVQGLIPAALIFDRLGPILVSRLT